MKKKLDVNEYLVVVGDFGLCQWIIMLLAGLHVASSGSQMFVSVFTRVMPKFRCDDEEYLNMTSHSNLTYDNSCNYTVNQVVKNCTKFAFDTDLFKSTIRTEWSLVCDRETLDTAIGMVFMACIGVGAVIGSSLSDKFGRKPVLVCTNILTGIFGIIAAFAPTFPVYFVLRSLLGLVNGCVFIVSVTLVMESVAANKRSHAMNIIELFWIVGSSSLSLIAFIFRRWWEIQLFISVTPVITGLLSIWVLYESPHWLQLQGRSEQTLLVLSKMASLNGCHTGDLIFKIDDLEDDAASSTESAKQEGENCCRIWSYSRLTIRFMVLNFAWISCSLCYYALSFGVADLAGNIFINNFIMCSVEGLAYLSCFSMAVLGRKLPTIFMFFLGGCSLLISISLILFVKDNATYVTVLSMIGKFAISAAFQCVIVWSNELYPTTVRCTLSSINSIVGKIGSIMAPFLVDLKHLVHVPHEDIIMPSVFVALMIGAGILHFIPPETNHRVIPETMDEANAVCFPRVGSRYVADELNTEADEHTALLST